MKLSAQQIRMLRFKLKYPGMCSKLNNMEADHLLKIFDEHLLKNED